MAKRISKHKNWMLLIILLITTFFNFSDLRHQVLESTAENINLEADLSSIVDSDMNRTFASFEYIASDIIGHKHIKDKSTNWSEQANVITQMAFQDHDVFTYIRKHYGSSGKDWNLNGENLIWRLEHDTKNHSISLVMGKVDHYLDDSYFNEIEFELSHYPPFIPYQFDAELIYEDINHTLLRRQDSFESIRFEAPILPNLANNSHAFKIASKQILGYQYWELNGDTQKQYHMMEIPIDQLNGKLKVFWNRTEQLQFIYEDIFELFVTFFGIGIIYFLSNFSLKYMEKTQRMLNTDALTNLKNRRHLNDSKNKIQTNLVTKKYVCYGMILLDIDHFKSVNDTYGHSVGDEVLTRIGRILKENVREVDECYRLGGEEFMITVPVVQKKQILRLAQRVRMAVEEDNQLHALIEGGITVSVGVSALNIGEKIEESMIRADEQLYKAKDSGRNRVKYPKTVFC